MAFEDGSDPTYLVLVNHEDQYSLWPQSKSVPLGWRETGFAGNKAACASYVDAVWTDMRPASLRAAAEEAS